MGRGCVCVCVGVFVLIFFPKMIANKLHSVQPDMEDSQSCYRRRSKDEVVLCLACKMIGVVANKLHSVTPVLGD